ncbi:MAG: 50S ribosomal protein L11 methyltransferase [Thiogranum sp.]|nr:50S ribosomal protein L11 methyltransferase [Thiogranum sp.]
MPWQQLSIEAGDLDAEALSDFFSDRGAVSVTFIDAADQPLYEPDPGTTPLWSSTRVTALFESVADVASVKQQLAASFGAATLERLTDTTVDDQDWERVWLDQFRPMRFGNHLWVCPDGMRPPDDDQAVIIDLDPGLAFGTGTHPTTALCLAWLDAHPPRAATVIDYGCGSGILAIAALKLGAEAVWAVDIDPQALWASNENAERNQVAERLHTLLPDALPAQLCDLLLANILANPLLELAPQLAARVRPGGAVVLSGILEDQADRVRTAYARWFDMAPVQLSDGWACLQGIRSDGSVR